MNIKNETWVRLRSFKLKSKHALTKHFYIEDISFQLHYGSLWRIATRLAKCETASQICQKLSSHNLTSHEAWISRDTFTWLRYRLQNPNRNSNMKSKSDLVLNSSLSPFPTNIQAPYKFNAKRNLERRCHYNNSTTMSCNRVNTSTHLFATTIYIYNRKPIFILTSVNFRLIRCYSNEIYILKLS